jgi:hypothetical protein
MEMDGHPTMSPACENCIGGSVRNTHGSHFTNTSFKFAPLKSANKNEKTLRGKPKKLYLAKYS